MEKKKNKKKKIGLFIGIAIALVIAVVVLVLVLSGGHRVIKINSYSGTVSLERENEAMDIVQNMNLKSEDVVTTGADGIVELLLDTDKMVLAQSDTRFSILASGNENKGSLHIKLEYGTALARIDNKLPEGSTFEVETPNASMSVRGTMFTTSYNPRNNVSVVITNNGVVEVAVGTTVAQVNAGEMAIIEDDAVIVEPIPFAYTEQTLFEATILETEQGSGVYVKELVDWTHEILDVNGIRVDEMVKDDLRIRYWVQTKAEIDENTQWLADNGYLMSTGVMRNLDGELVSWAMTGQDGKPFTYRLYKEITEEYYLHINVYVADGTTFKTDDTLEEFLLITNDCYYVIGDATENTTEETSETTATDDVPGTIVTKEDIPTLRVTGTAVCFMTLNEEGKYHINYLRENERQGY